MSTMILGKPMPAGRREKGIALCGLAVLALIGVAFAKAAGRGALPSVGTSSPWLILHLATIVPALPLGAFVLARPKGDRLHRICGWTWSVLMIVAALSSFGLVGLMGHLSPIHALSVLTLVAVPRAILNARAGRIAQHRRGMMIVYASMVVAGLFTFLPTRLLGHWLFG